MTVRDHPAEEVREAVMGGGSADDGRNRSPKNPETAMTVEETDRQDKVDKFESKSNRLGQGGKNNSQE